MTGEEDAVRRPDDRGAAPPLNEPILRAAASTFGPRVMLLSGLSAGLFRLDYDEKIFQRNYRHPVLAAACHGAADARVRLALCTGRLRDVGADLAAACINDVLPVGAEPLFMLHHVSALDAAGQAAVAEGLADPCRQAGCALLTSGPGEPPSPTVGAAAEVTAFAVGVVDHRRMVAGTQVEPGDEMIGIAGAGLHGSAFEAVAEVLLEQRGLAPQGRVEELNATVAEELLRPARVYSPAVLRVLRYYRRKRVVAGMAHVWDGGLSGTVMRLLPEGCRARIDPTALPVPEVYRFLEQSGTARQNMWCTYTMGVGFVMVVRPTFAQSIVKQLQRRGQQCRRIGTIARGVRGVEAAEGACG